MLIFFDADDFPPQISCEQHTDRPTDHWDRNITSFCRDKKRTRSWSSFHQTDCGVNRDCVPLAGNTNMVGYLKNDETIQHIHTVSVRLPSAGIWLDLATNNILLPPSRPLWECVCERVCVCVCVSGWIKHLYHVLLCVQVHVACMYAFVRMTFPLAPDTHKGGEGGRKIEREGESPTGHQCSTVPHNAWVPLSHYYTHTHTHTHTHTLPLNTHVHMSTHMNCAAPRSVCLTLSPTMPWVKEWRCGAAGRRDEALLRTAFTHRHLHPHPLQLPSSPHPPPPCRTTGLRLSATGISGRLACMSGFLWAHTEDAG